MLGCELCGSGSVGRASPCQGEGRGFESRLPLQVSPVTFVTGVLFCRKYLCATADYATHLINYLYRSRRRKVRQRRYRDR